MAKGATLCHPAQLLGGVRALGTHRGDCSIHLFTRYISFLYQVEDFLGVWSVFCREGRVGGR